MNTRILIGLIGGGGLALGAPAATPDTRISGTGPSAGTVTLPLTELRELWEHSRQAPATPAPHPPPVGALITELVLDLSLEPGRSRGTVTASVRTLAPDWQRVELFGGDLGVDQVTGEAAVDLTDDGYGVLLHQVGTTAVELAVTAPGVEAWQPETPVLLTMAPGTARKVRIHHIPPGHRLSLGDQYASPDAKGTATFTLGGRDSSLKLAVTKAEDRPPARTESVALAQAVIPSLVCHQRLVMDGGLLTTIAMEVRHRQDTVLALTLPPGADLLQCAVAGTPAQPKTRDQGIELTLAGAAAATGTTRLELAYFTKLPPLSPAGGTLQLALPHSPLFHERLEWTLDLPECVQTTSLRSNAEAAKPIQGARSISLKREFWKADPVTAELHYAGARP